MGGPGPRSRGGKEADCREGGRAEPDQPALGLPLPHPLPLRLRPLLERGAGDARGHARPPRRLPPARSPAGCTHASRGASGVGWGAGPLTPCPRTSSARLLDRIALLVGSIALIGIPHPPN